MSDFAIESSVGALRGEIAIPPSKSQSLRAILFGTLAQGTTIIHNYLHSPDTTAMIEACCSLGATIQVDDNYLKIEGINGKIQAAEDVIQAGNSGIVLRFIAGVAALAPRPIVITGDYSIRHYRPMQSLLKALTELQASAISTKGDGYAPVIIQGPLKGGKAHLQGTDSQPISALLIASIFAQSPVELIVENPGEKPWVDLTLHWLDRLALPYERQQFNYYRLPGQGHYSGFNYRVPADFSSAAFPLAAAIVTQSAVQLQDLDCRDHQGDKQLIEILRAMGAHIVPDEAAKTINIKPGTSFQGLSIDVNNCIDALPILAVLGCYAEGETHLRNGAIARQKECDRIHCIATELRKMGGEVVELPDGLIIRSSQLKGAEVNSHQDHRIAMALSIAALGAQGKTIVRDVECVNKTCSNFADDLQQLGASIQKIL